MITLSYVLIGLQVFLFGFLLGHALGYFLYTTKN